MSSPILPMTADAARFRDGMAGKRLPEALLLHVSDRGFPCVGAKSVVAKHRLRVIGCGRIDRADDDRRIHDAFAVFAQDLGQGTVPFWSLAAVFEGPRNFSEVVFERVLWQRVQGIADIDRRLGFVHDPRVSDDPANPEFSLSFRGQAFYLVGLHPHASRSARRFAQPTLVFNLHSVFERLRASGRYEKMRETIMVRDEALAGSRNPMLKRHGDASAARQYSGRIVDDDWRCPFRRVDAR